MLNTLSMIRDIQLKGSNLLDYKCNNSNIVHPETCVDMVKLSNNEDDNKTLKDWMEEQTPGNIEAASDTTLGGIKIGYVGNYSPVKLDSNNKAYVEVEDNSYFDTKDDYDMFKVNIGKYTSVTYFLPNGPSILEQYKLLIDITDNVSEESFITIDAFLDKNYFDEIDENKIWFEKPEGVTLGYSGVIDKIDESSNIKLLPPKEISKPSHYTIQIRYKKDNNLLFITAGYRPCEIIQ